MAQGLGDRLDRGSRVLELLAGARAEDAVVPVDPDLAEDLPAGCPPAVRRVVAAVLVREQRLDRVRVEPDLPEVPGADVEVVGEVRPEARKDPDPLAFRRRALSPFGCWTVRV